MVCLFCTQKYQNFWRTKASRKGKVIDYGKNKQNHEHDKHRKERKTD